MGIDHRVLHKLMKTGSCRIWTLSLIAQVLGLELTDFDLKANEGLYWTAKSHLGQRIQWLARTRGWTDSELAERSGISASTLAHVVQGVTCTPSIILDVATTLHVTFKELAQLWEGDKKMGFYGKIPHRRSHNDE